MADTFVTSTAFTTSFTIPSERPLSYGDMPFYAFDETKARLAVALMKMETETRDDPQFNDFEYDVHPYTVTLSGAMNATITTMTIAAAAPWIRQGQTLIAPSTGEVVRISAAPASPYTSFTVTRHIGGSAAGLGIADAATLHSSGTAYGEGTGAPAGYFRKPSLVTNYTQIFKRSTQRITGTADKTKIRAQLNKRTKAKNDALMQVYTDMELAFLYGHGAETTDEDGNPLTLTSGVSTLLSTNVADYSSTGIDYETFQDACVPIARRGKSTTRLGIGGDLAVHNIVKMIEARTLTTIGIEQLPSTENFGLDIKRIYAGGLTINLMRSPLLSEIPDRRGDLFLLDMGVIKRVKHGSRGEIQYFDDIRDNKAQDWWQASFQVETGLKLMIESAHAWWRGINTFNP